MYIRKGLTRAGGWAMYLERVASLLARPEAPGVLMRGGILARIALEFGSPHLIQRLILGPSYNASPVAGHVHLLSDQPTDLFISVLLGYTEAASGGVLRSWFPPPELMDEYLDSSLEWTPACEEWICGRMKSLRELSSFDARPLSRVEWRQQLKTYSGKMFSQRSCTSPTAPALEEVNSEMNRVCGHRGMNGCTCRRLSSFSKTIIRSDSSQFNVSW